MIFACPAQVDGYDVQLDLARLHNASRLVIGEDKVVHFADQRTQRCGKRSQTSTKPAEALIASRLTGIAHYLPAWEPVPGSDYFDYYSAPS